MVVDDNPDILTSLEAGLSLYDENFDVIKADSGKRCLELLNSKTTKPDIIFLDIMMPEMTGWETFDKIKENNNWKNIPIVFLTAKTDDVSKTSGKYLADEYIEKPFNIENIVSIINKLITNKD